ncbi:hypothetical protein E2C01_008064 [Portunus trituberculatus]|uniref:Uncharacterized protein n=1 Tax=Portunus trituberculatus TaxID=210409 RepID=A0A5B7D1C2_PORTR|nr:hypothetical protein [Portunus trituberculatus]
MAATDSLRFHILFADREFDFPELFHFHVSVFPFAAPELWSRLRKEQYSSYAQHNTERHLRCGSCYSLPKLDVLLGIQRRENENQQPRPTKARGPPLTKRGREAQSLLWCEGRHIPQLSTSR